MMSTEAGRGLKLILICLLMAFLFGLNPISPVDFFWNVKSAEWLFQNGQIPTTDFFSYTMTGTAWVQHEWGAGVIFYLVYTYGGPYALNALSILLFSLYLYFAARTFQTLSGKVHNPVWLIFLLAFLSTHRMIIRPHIFTNLFLAILFYLLALHSQGKLKTKHAILIFSALFMAWANLHGGVILGAGLAMAYFGWRAVVERKGRAEFLIAISIFLAPLVNPYFFEIYLFPFRHLHMEAIIAVTEEWQPPYLAPWNSYLVFQGYFVVLSLSVMTLAIKARKIPFFTFFCATAMTYLSLKHNRYSAIFCLWALPFLWQHLPTLFKLRKEEDFSPRPALTALVLAAAAGLILLRGVPTKWNGSFIPLRAGMNMSSEPTEGIRFLKESGLKAPLFHTIGFSNFLIPHSIPVFIDGRTPMYGDDFFRAYFRALYRPDDFDALRKKWDLGAVMLPPGVYPNLERHLRKSGEWTEVFSDPKAIIFADHRDAHRDIQAK